LGRRSWRGKERGGEREKKTEERGKESPAHSHGAVLERHKGNHRRKILPPGGGRHDPIEKATKLKEDFAKQVLFFVYVEALNGVPTDVGRGSRSREKKSREQGPKPEQSQGETKLERKRKANSPSRTENRRGCKMSEKGIQLLTWGVLVGGEKRNTAPKMINSLLVPSIRSDAGFGCILKKTTRCEEKRHYCKAKCLRQREKEIGAITTYPNAALDVSTKRKISLKTTASGKKNAPKCRGRLKERIPTV